MNSAQTRPPIPTTAGETIRELYRNASPIILTILAVGLVAYRLWLGNWRPADLIAPLAILLIWPFFEWVIHVKLLHMKPPRMFGRTINLNVGRTHRKHHVDPNDLSDITINLEVFPTVVPVIFLLAYGLMPTIELATGALAMFFVLALHYEWCHFMAHVRWTPPLSYYRRRQRMHRLHHFRNENLWWGVSTGIGDLVLGTAPDAADAPRSPTVYNVNGMAGTDTASHG
jgi:sterol desaturase/sphingolipid hydroxylase (fatty acid hydroxylase superfamily)